MKHIASDIKNIKDSLHRMEKYILGKSIKGDKANDIKNLKRVRKAVWRFITVLYNSHWDSLIVDGTDRSFRNNIKYKFSSQVIKDSTKSKKSNVANLSYVSPHSSLIPAKLAKEVNEISKYFKKQPSNIAKKSYAQVSANSSNSSNVAREMLKIKEAFSSLQNKKNWNSSKNYQQPGQTKTENPYDY